MQNRPVAPLPAHPDVIIESDDRVWSGLFPVDVVRFRQLRFDGTLAEARSWELLRRGRAAALIPYDPWTDSVVMIEQFRLPALAAGLDPVLVEIPAGLCEAEEPGDTTMLREIQEETRLQADRLERIGTFLLSPGGSDETCELFAGRVRLPEPAMEGDPWYAGEAGENEDIRVRAWPAEAAIAAAFAGKFANVVTTLGLFWLAAKRDGLRQAWMEP